MRSPRFSKRSANNSSRRKITEKQRVYLSNRAKKQNRNPDGSFAKGFKTKPHSSTNYRNHRNAKKRTCFASVFSKFTPNHISAEQRHIKNKIAGSNIRVTGTKSEIEAIEKQLVSNFDKDELKRVSQHGISIVVKDLSKNGKNRIAGLFEFKRTNEGRELILIDNDAVWDNETLTHEMTHLCRCEDNERTGFGKSRLFAKGNSRAIDDKDVPLEEAMTVSETIARTDPELNRYYANYYAHIKKDGINKINHQKALDYKEKDIKTIKNECRGVTYKDKLYEKITHCFHKLKIRHLRNDCCSAIERFDELSKDGKNG